jgi:hypothetical protein
MACGWFIDEVDLSRRRVPITAEFHKWASWERWHDRTEVDDRDEASGRWGSIQERARVINAGQAR